MTAGSWLIASQVEEAVAISAVVLLQERPDFLCLDTRGTLIEGASSVDGIHTDFSLPVPAQEAILVHGDRDLA